MRNLENMNHKDAVKNSWKILKDGHYEIVAKATYCKDGVSIMKSTKRMKIDGGYLYNITTEFHKMGQVTIAEACCFVPDAVKSEVTYEVKDEGF